MDHHPIEAERRLEVWADFVRILSRREESLLVAVKVQTDARRRRILVVDDNRDAAETLAELLEELGYTSHVAYASEDALAVASRFDPGVAIVDLGMPGMDGYALAEQLQAQRSGIRLIALSGYADAHRRMRSEQVGFEVHFVKPIPIQLLLDRLDRTDTR